jgi:hypothetical protein
MKQFLFALISLCLSHYSYTQITLDFTNAPSIALCQSFDSATTLKLKSLPAIAPGEDAVWDFTAATDSSNVFRKAFVANNQSFPEATFQTEIFYPFSGLRYIGNLMQNVTSDGIAGYGVHIDRQAIPLALLTGSTTDSLIFNKQDVHYSTPSYLVKYPISIGDQWTNTYKFKTSFALTILAYGLVATPGERRTEYITTNEVIGWGKTKINDKNGNPASPTDVLLIKRTQTAIDSFYLAGSPAPALLLNAFGLTQGQVDKNYHYIFQRAGEYYGMVEIGFADSSYTKVENVYVQQLRLYTSSVKKGEKVPFTVFPNPITTRSFTIHVTGEPDQYSYQLINLSGQAISEGKLSTNSNINLSENITSGSYFLKVFSKTGQFSTQPIQIVY